MKSLRLPMLFLCGLAVLLASFTTDAMAAPRKHRVAHGGSCGPIHASRADVIAALTSNGMTGGPLYVNGRRVCVDTAHPFYQWSDGSTSPAPPEGRGWRPAPALW